MSEEIKIITLGDIFKNIETEEKAFKFKDYIKYLQQKVEQLENIIKEAIKLLKKCGIVDEKGNFNACLDSIELNDLLNILNKGGISKYE